MTSLDAGKGVKDPKTLGSHTPPPVDAYGSIKDGKNGNMTDNVRIFFTVPG